MKTTTYILSLGLVFSFALTNVATAQTTEKKKWSPTTKGAVIGAGTGAAAGAIINKKNRVAGGIVGGAVGGAVGAGVGKVIDNKQKKNAAEEQARIDEMNRVAAQNRAAEEAAVARSNANTGVSHTGTARTYTATKTKTTARAGSQQTVATPAAAGVQPAYMQHGWILNDAPADPNIAYSTAQFKRKSW